MSKKVIECEYCHTLISEEDNKCPSCGANCSSAIKKYRKEQEKKLAEEKSRKEKMLNDSIKTVSEVGQQGAKYVFVIAVIIIAMVILITLLIFFNFSREIDRQREESMNTTNNIIEDNKQEIVKVGFNEKAETKDMVVLLDNYDKYAYHSDFFKNYNTPDRYQKIAFHFEIQNKKTRDLYVWSEGISLTADDYKVETTSLKAPGDNFAKVTEGQASYEDISSATIKSESTLKGYVGFLVPKDKKTLVFRVGNYITITMDNPVYSN